MPEQISLGDELEFKKRKCRAVRIITHSQTLFESKKEGEGLYITDESYVEVKFEDGTIDFIILHTDRLPYEGKPSNIKSLYPIPINKGGE